MMGKRKSSSRGAGDSASYEVGYQKPPKHSQFKPGQSGNPKGRPKGHKNFKTTFRDVLAEKVVIREGERTRRVPKLEAVIRMTLNKALMNDSKAIGSFLQFVRFSGALEDDPAGAEAGDLLPEDHRILENYWRRRLETMTHADQSDSGSDGRPTRGELKADDD